MSQFNRMTSLFYAPGATFDDIRERPTFSLPLLALLAGLSLVWIWYYSTVDLPWLQDHLLQSKSNLDPKELEVARSLMSRGFLMGISLFGTLVFTPIMLLIWATYYLLVNRVTGNAKGIRSWFAFAVYCTLPLLLNVAVMAVQILLARQGQVSPEALNALSLNQLVFHLPPGHPGAAVLESLTLLTFWSIALGIIGLRRWGVRSVFSAVAIAVAPYALVYGVWGLIALLRASA